MFTKTATACAAAIAAMGITSPLMAQQVSGDIEKDLLDEIIVTATKFDTDLMDTPIAVSAFSEEDLDKLGISNVKDLNNLVPNMSIMVDVESNAPIITMRGVRSTNTTEWGDPAVGVHFDGIYSPRPQGSLAMMFDIDHVEVLRGPQGTLFGRNSTVGTANIISARPDFEDNFAKLDFEVGRYDHQSVKGVFNLPVSNTFALRAAVFSERRDSNLEGYYDPNQWDQRYLDFAFTPTDSAATPAGQDGALLWAFEDTLYEEVKADPSDFYNMVNQYGARLTGYWKPNTDVAWLITLERYEDDSAGGINMRDCDRIRNRPADVNGGNCTDIWGNEENFVAYVNIPGKNDMTIDSLRSHFTWQFSESVEFAYNMGYQSQERAGQIDLDQGYYFWDQMLKWVDTDYDAWSHEVQFKSIGENRLQWVAGYFNFEEDNFMNGQYQGAMGGVSLWNQPKRIIKSDAFFGQMTYGLTEKLYLTVGARHTRDSKEDIGGRNLGCWESDCHPNAWGEVPWGAPNFDDLLPTPTRDNFNALPADYFDWPNANFKVDTENDVYEEWSKTTWRLGLDYDVSENTMVYAYAANGYKGGGVGDVLIKESDGKRFDTSYDAEEVITYELGIKTKALDGKLNLRANAFYSDYENQQFTTWTIYDSRIVFEVDPDTQEPVETIQEIGTFLTRNASDSRITGIELEGEWIPWDGGFIGGYFTTLDTEITSEYWKAWGTEAPQVFAGYVEGPLDKTKAWFRNLEGNDLAYAPKYSFTMNLSHTFTLPNGATLSPFLNVHWEDESYVSIDNTDKWDLDPSDLNANIDLDIYSDKRDAWAMATASLNYTSVEQNWFAEAFVYNLTDEDVNWWQGYAGNTPMAAKAQRSYGLRFGYSWQ
jgi:iron complex outermembrane receptor protein